MRKTMLAILAVLLITVSACQNNNPGEKKITIAYVNWAEGIAMTHLAKSILEHKGYTVTLKNADVAPVFAAVAGGDADVFLDTWMPVTHKTYMENFGEKITVLNTNFEAAKIGLVVPDYVDVNSIADLEKYKSTFDGKVVGIDAGAGIMTKAEEAIHDYSLDYQLQSSSEAAMLATLKKSITEKQPIIITGWQPHFMFTEYKLRFLEDPKKVFGDTEKILTIANNEFTTRDTTAVSFFRKFKMTDSQLNSLLGDIAKADGNEEKGVRNWMAENPELIQSWE
ncbi:glycine betaine ABC transporter substrate-binding protein [Chitinophaga sp.]|uniref:glycine betaine ABC transporter substrate-binding protein n=1 Tax=Chitinophaga sp. TaxID=1869181 RepID=UPI0025C0E8BF|nr:glycine betaine ABC transporter substrate-binding protein [Chitinophaga sp.]